MSREQMREAIQIGIDAYHGNCFTGGQIPVCAVTGYPLTPDNSAVRFTLSYPYRLIEDTFLEYVKWDENETLTLDQLQAWAAYFWQYARLELVETFPPMALVSDEIRAKTHREMKAMGYTRVTNAAGDEAEL